jgi:hypothetical protein
MHVYNDYRRHKIEIKIVLVTDLGEYMACHIGESMWRNKE